MRKRQFETERLFFSYWLESDSALADELWGDEHVTQFIAKNGRFSKDQVLQRLHTEIQSQKDFGYQYWPLFLKQTETFIGCCGLHAYELNTQTAVLGFHLLPSAWGRGFAEEAARGVINFAESKTDLAFLFAGHHPDNRASKKLLEKLGFQFQANTYYEPTGLEHPSYLLKLTSVS